MSAIGPSAGDRQKPPDLEVQAGVSFSNHRRRLQLRRARKSLTARAFKSTSTNLGGVTKEIISIMRIKRSVVFLVSALVLAAITGGLSGQVTKLTDPDVFTASAVSVGLGNTISGTPAADLYRHLGIWFLSDGEGVPEIRAILTVPTIPPISEDVLRNAAPEGTSSNGALLIQFDSPLRRVGMNLSNGDAESAATLEAFSPDFRLLGGVRQEGLADVPGVFVGLETTDPRGISALRLRYDGDDPEEQIQSLRFEPLEPRPFVVYLAQTASGAMGDLRVETVIQVQNLLGDSRATRVDF